MQRKSYKALDSNKKKAELETLWPLNKETILGEIT